MFKKILALATLLQLSIAPIYAEEVPPPPDPNVRHYLTIPNGGLADFLKRPPMAIPMVSYHRGGAAPGFPENSLEAMDNALAYGYGLMEIDVAQLRDGTLILMHDDTLNRTTTGNGKVADKTFDYVRELFLKDNEGNVTGFSVPTLEQALKWAIGRTVLTLDIKRGVDFQRVASLVQAAEATDYVAAIAYSLEQAKTFHKIAPDMPLSISFFDAEDITAFDRSGIPAHLVLAWTGTRLKAPSFYRSLQARGWRVFVGTLGRGPQAIDNQIRDGQSDLTYFDIVRRGADIIATDRFWAVQAEIANPNLFIFGRAGLAKVD